MKTDHALSSGIFRDPRCLGFLASFWSASASPLKQKFGRNRFLKGIMIQLAIILLVAAALARTEAWSIGSETSIGTLRFPAAVTVTFPRYEYKLKERSLKSIDFKDLRYHLFGKSLLFNESIRLHNGSGSEYRRKEGIHTELSLKNIWYFGVQNDQPHYALVYLDFFSVGGSSSDYGFILLFTIENGHPVIIQQLDYDRQAPGTAVHFNVGRGELIIKARARDGSAHCCPESLETDEFRWTGRIFKLRNRTITKLTAGQQ
jgi:hypothetical protein